jgi:hypothetical protein
MRCQATQSHSHVARPDGDATHDGEIRELAVLSTLVFAPGVSSAPTRIPECCIPTIFFLPDESHRHRLMVWHPRIPFTCPSAV